MIQPLTAAAIFSSSSALADLPSEGIPYPVFVFARARRLVLLLQRLEAAAESLVETASWSRRCISAAARAARRRAARAVDLASPGSRSAVFMAVYGVAPTPRSLLPALARRRFAPRVRRRGLAPALNVQYRDVRHTLDLPRPVWFFASPIVFTELVVEGGWSIFALNPMVGLLEGFRWSLLDGPAPGRRRGLARRDIAAPRRRHRLLPAGRAALADVI